MFLNSHKLNSIITKSFDSRKYIISEVGICIDDRFLDAKERILKHKIATGLSDMSNLLIQLTKTKLGLCFKPDIAELDF